MTRNRWLVVMHSLLLAALTGIVLVCAVQADWWRVFFGSLAAVCLWLVRDDLTKTGAP